MPPSKPSHVDLEGLEKARDMFVDLQHKLDNMGSIDSLTEISASGLQPALGNLVDGGKTAMEMQAFYGQRAQAVTSSITGHTIPGVTAAIGLLDQTIAKYETNETNQAAAADGVGNGPGSPSGGSGSGGSGTRGKG